MPASPAQEVAAGRFRRQARWCRDGGEPLYAELLERAAGDIEAGGVAWEAIAPYAGEPAENALALRFLAAVHRLVLAGRAPELARHYRSAGGTAGAAGAWEPFQRVVAANLDQVRAAAGRPCQTNEVGRAAALLGGFLEVARRTRSRLRILEVGTSAGLNLRWDRFRYSGWGDPASPVDLAGMFDAPPPLRPASVAVVERAGCDLQPLDPTTEDGALTLASFTWPERVERLRRLRGAIEVARAVPAEIDRADAADWLGRRLAAPWSGVATVVFHSVFRQYLDEPRRRRLVRVIRAAGAAAAVDAPLAWLRLEPGASSFEVWLTLWPGGEERLFGTSGAHGDGFRYAG